jgi:hypothetical protein
MGWAFSKCLVHSDVPHGQRNIRPRRWPILQPIGPHAFFDSAEVETKNRFDLCVCCWRSRSLQLDPWRSPATARTVWSLLPCVQLLEEHSCPWARAADGFPGVSKGVSARPLASVPIQKIAG